MDTTLRDARATPCAVKRQSPSSHSTTQAPDVANTKQVPQQAGMGATGTHRWPRFPRWPLTTACCPRQ